MNISKSTQRTIMIGAIAVCALSLPIIYFLVHGMFPALETSITTATPLALSPRAEEVFKNYEGPKGVAHPLGAEATPIHFPRYSISLRYPEGWYVANPSEQKTLVAPQYVSIIDSAIIGRDGNCAVVVALAKLPNVNDGELNQSSFSVLYVVPGTTASQHDIWISRYIPTALDTARVPDEQLERVTIDTPFRPGEFAITAAPIAVTENESSRLSLVLISTKDNVISKDCLDAFASIASSAELSYASAGHINDTTKGRILLSRENGLKLLLVTEGNPETTLLASFDASQAIPWPAFDKNTFYWIDGTNTLFQYHLIDGVVTTLSLDPNLGSTNKVYDFFRYGESIYFLYGEGCDGFGESCNLALYVNKNGVNTLLRKGMHSVIIKGADKQRGVLYLEWAYGEFGAGMAISERFNMNTNAYSSSGQFSYIYPESEAGGTPTKEEAAGAQQLIDIQNLVKDTMTGGYALELASGAVFPLPIETPLTTSGEYFRFFR